ncbi:MAG TPA: hypothetical protein VJL57_00850 [Candidatus Paceibacterota bacterium]
MDSIEQRQKYLGENPLNVEKYELEPLRAARQNGFRHVLRLPRDNYNVLVEKYGIHFDKLTVYHDFVKTLAKRRGIDIFHLYDSDYAFRTQQEADTLRDDLRDRQLKLKLGFEAVEDQKPLQNDL